jgi:hypothetical protein
MDGRFGPLGVSLPSERPTAFPNSNDEILGGLAQIQ